MNKNIFLLTLIILVLCFLCCSCNNVHIKQKENNTEEVSETGESVISDDYNSDLQIVYDDYNLSWEYLPEYGGIETRFISLVDKEEFEQWSQNFKHINSDGNRNGYEYNIYNFIKDFNISKDEFIRVNKDFGRSVFTDEQMDILFSADEEYILEQITNPYAVRIGEKIYTPYWLATHTAEDYLAENISVSALEAKKDKIMSILPEDLAEAFESSCSDFEKNLQ